MPNYRRLKICGSTYFFTVVTYQRQAFLTANACRSYLRSAWLDVGKRFPFSTIAVCLLPDHLHCVWSLPENDADYSVRWREIKRLFTKEFVLHKGQTSERNESRLKRNEATIWQRRFWEHLIRDDDDLHHHLDYIHFNPVKHGVVKTVADWPWSSFHRYVRLGYYEQGWGNGSGEIGGELYFRE